MYDEDRIRRERDDANRALAQADLERMTTRREIGAVVVLWLTGVYGIFRLVMWAGGGS